MRIPILTPLFEVAQSTFDPRVDVDARILAEEAKLREVDASLGRAILSIAANDYRNGNIYETGLLAAKHIVHTHGFSLAQLGLSTENLETIQVITSLE